MKSFFQIFLLITSISVFSLSTIACTNDVEILEGSTITLCENSTTLLHGEPGFSNYVWSGAGTSLDQNIDPVNPGWYYLEAVDGVGCISKDSILVTIAPNPTPSINSSEGLILCEGSSGTLLTLDQAYSSQTWSTGSTDPSILVTNSGSYGVTVTNNNGCSGTALITITKPNFQLETLGASAVCLGSTVTLVASGGDAYAWSTGEFGSTIVVSPDVETTYSVTIFKGSCSATLSQTVSVVEAEPFELADTIFALPGEQVYVFGPSGFSDYNWSPEEMVSDPDADGVNFTAEESFVLNLNATSPQGCQINDSVFIQVLNLTIPGGFSPNNDTYNDLFIIPELSTLTAKIVFWNRWGDIVYSSDSYMNDWDGTCQGQFCLGSGDLPEGTYFYLLEIGDKQIDGFITLKR